jgi:hypothetical protein
VRDQNTLVEALCFDEHLGKGGVRLVSAMRSQSQLGVTSELELPAPHRTIRHREPPQFTSSSAATVTPTVSMPDTAMKLGAIRGK